MDYCFICHHDTPSYDLIFTGPGVRIPCPVCGTFRLSERVVHDLQATMPSGLFGSPQGSSLHVESGAIRELVESGADVFVANLADLRSAVQVPEDPLDSIDKILLYSFRHTTSAAEYVRLNPDTDYSVAYSRDSKELTYLVEKAHDLGLLEIDEQNTEGLRLSLRGWERIRQLRTTRANARQAFVAMWFSTEMDALFTDAIRPALEATGYQALRIDLSEHNEKIDDRIIAEIRKSAFLVADVTGHRPGVYFEAGFALGLGLPVIWTCKDTDLQNAHFDTRQYNHILWRDIEELRSKLQARIEATLPTRSPLRRST